MYLVLGENVCFDLSSKRPSQSVPYTFIVTNTLGPGSSRYLQIKGKDPTHEIKNNYIFLHILPLLEYGRKNSWFCKKHQLLDNRSVSNGMGLLVYLQSKSPPLSDR